MQTKADAHLTLDRLHQDVGVFHTIIPDNALELTEGEFRKKAIHAGSRLCPVEAYMHNKNLAESGIRELRRMSRKAMVSTNAPHILWDHCIYLMGEIRSHSALDLPELEGYTPYTRLTGDTCDISHLCEFKWYEVVWYVDPPDKMEKRKLGRYLGPRHDIGQAMCCKILTITGTVLSRTSVVPLSVEDKNSDIVKEKLKSFDTGLAQALGDRAQGIVQEPDHNEIDEYVPYEDAHNEAMIVPEAEDIDIDAHHRLISSKVMLPQGGQVVTGRVVRRKRDNDGNLIGQSHTSPLLDTSLFEVEFEDGHTEAYTENLIAEHLYELIDSEGQVHRMMDEVIDHKRLGDAVHTDDSRTADGKLRQTTKGWKLCVQWKDGTLTWEKLSLLKEGYPIEIAEYATANNLLSEPAFIWWAGDVLRKRERILSKLNCRYLRRKKSSASQYLKVLEKR
jgi:hypothetical protein